MSYDCAVELTGAIAKPVEHNFRFQVRQVANHVKYSCFGDSVVFSRPVVNVDNLDNISIVTAAVVNAIAVRSGSRRCFWIFIVRTDWENRRRADSWHPGSNANAFCQVSDRVIHSWNQ